MDYRTFGRTGLRISIVGVGGGGASRLGLATGSTDSEAVRVVQRAHELGVNYFDSAHTYKTEHIFGEAFEHCRDEVVLSSKVSPKRDDGSLLDAAGLRSAVDLSLQRLRTDRIDVFHLHRASARTYDYCVSELVPEMERLRLAGKIRFIGVSESTGDDVEHAMLQLAVSDDCWDAIMIGFNLFNQSARATVFPAAIEKDLAIEIMASARSQFSRPELLVAEVRRLVDTGELDPTEVTVDDPLDFLYEAGAANSLTETSYRFAAHEPGVHVVLTGTGSMDHLEENIGAMNSGPLPETVRGRLISLFGHLQAEVHVPGRSSRR